MSSGEKIGSRGFGDDERSRDENGAATRFARGGDTSELAEAYKRKNPAQRGSGFFIVARA